MRFFLILIFSLFSFQAMAYELLVIQAVSTSSKTFLTRNGKEKGVFRGKKSTFTADNVSIIATAINVTREQTLWRIENDFTTVPFKKGDVVTFYDATEYLWALNPEEVKRKFIKNKIHENKTSLEFFAGLNHTLSESVSEVAAENSQRGGLQFGLGIERELSESFAIAFLVRYEKETINASAATLSNQRVLGIVEPRYYFPPIRAWNDSRLFIGLGFGYGRSQTSTTAMSTAGNATLLPAAKLAIEIPLQKEEWKLVAEGAFETLSTEEKMENGTSQNTNFSNLKTAIGLKRFF